MASLRKKMISLSVIILISLFLINTTALRADVGWEYTFDTSNSLDDWHIAYGNWTVEDGSLVVTDQCENVSVYEGCVNSIWHEQTSLTGAWSFDVLQSDREEFGVLFYFVGNGVTANIPDYHPAGGYVLRLSHHDKVALDYVEGGSYQYSISEYIPSNPLTNWIHFEITRDQVHEMIVYLNGSEILRATHDLVLTSENINIQAETGVRFDNFKFTESIASPSSTPAWIPLIVLMSITTLIILRKSITKL